MLRFPHKGYREKIWDHCAGAVIVEEAGARITDASGKCLMLGYVWGQPKWLILSNWHAARMVGA